MTVPSRIGTGVGGLEWFDEGDGLAGDGFAAADVADTFAGLGGDVDAVGGEVQQTSEVVTDGTLDRPELRFLGEDDHTHVDNPPASAVQALERRVEEKARVGALPLRVRVRAGVTNVSRAGGGQQRVGDGVQDHVGVAVTGEAARMLDADAAEDERPAWLETVAVVSDACSHGGDCTGTRPAGAMRPRPLSGPVR